MERIPQTRRTSTSRRVLLILAAVLAVAATLGLRPEPSSALAAGPSTGHPGLRLLFVANEGQFGAQTRFAVKSPGLSAYFASSEVALVLRGEPVLVRFMGASPAPTLEGLNRLPGNVNFLLGDRPENWRTGVAIYDGVIYRNLYRGIDLRYRAVETRLKSEFVVAPGADPSLIRWSYDRAQVLSTEGGGLVVRTSKGELREELPAVYQEIGGRRVSVKGGFRLHGDSQVGFDIGVYDGTRPLVIDPVLSYSTYLGGSGLDSARAIAVDSAGNAYIAGQTDSFNLPVTNPLQASSGSGVNANGNSLVYCTFLGGSWDDRAFGIAVDAAGNAYLTGWTYSSNFPTTAGARQRALGGGRDSFAVKLGPAGNVLAYSTYLGGSGHDSGNALAVDSAGDVYIGGETNSSNFPVTSAYQGSNQGRQDAFTLRLNASGSALVWSTYLGGNGDDRATSIAVDGSGAAYLTGGTDSSNYPTYNALQPSRGGGQDAFVTKINPDGRTLSFSTYLGGSGGTVGASETGTGIRVDSAGNVYVAGVTSSLNFPVVNALQAAHAGGTIDSFVAKLNNSGSALAYSTYLGGAGVDYATGLAVDSFGQASVAGYTSSSNFPAVNALQSVKSGGYDIFVSRLTAPGTALETSTYLGGSDSDTAYGVALDSTGAACLAGQTQSVDFPTKNPLQALNPGGLSAFVLKVADIAPTAVFRSTTGATILNTYGTSTAKSAGGWLTSEVSASRNAAGDTFVVGRNDAGRVWMNIFDNASQTWRGWVLAGENFSGSPAVAVASNGEAYVVAPDGASNYWLNRYRTAEGFLGWVNLGGSLSSNPAIAGARDGSLFIAGRSAAGVIWAGRYIPATGFHGWVSGGGAGAPVATGGPALCAGTDGAAYVAVRGADNAAWIGRFNGTAWGSWYSGGGTLGTDPDAAASAGAIQVSVTSRSGGVYTQRFTEGTGNGWQGWTWTNGYLQRTASAAVGGRHFVFGRDFLNRLWWYQSSAGWGYLGYADLAAGNPAASPK